MNQINIKNLEIILNQFGGPIHLSYQTKSISNITENLVKYHRSNFEKIEDYNISDLYSIYEVINYALLDLGEEEFTTVTGLDLYEDGYKLLNQIKNEILKL